MPISIIFRTLPQGYDPVAEERAQREREKVGPTRADSPGQALDGFVEMQG